MAAIKAITSDLGHAGSSPRSIADRLTLRCPLVFFEALPVTIRDDGTVR
jgi:hypothetical protein